MGLLAPMAFGAPVTTVPDVGRSVYVAKCLACHGATGKGDGPAARALQRPPKDFTDAAFWASTTDVQVRATITNGLPGTIMREFPMQPQQLDDLIAYLRSFEGK